MSRPVLIHPTDHSSFHPDEMIPFEWRLAPMGEACAVKVALYIGCDSAAPYLDLQGVKKIWISTHNDPWTRFNETADNLGLDPDATYYWQVVQQIPPTEGLVSSEVRAIHIEGEPLPLYDRLGLTISLPFMVPLRMPLNITISLYNDSDSPIQLTFPHRWHFMVDIYRTRAILGDKHVWTLQIPPPWSPDYSGVDTVGIPPRHTHKEVVTWRQIDFGGRPVCPGTYRVEVICKSHRFGFQRNKTFTLLRHQ